MIRPTIRQLEYLIAISEEKSFLAASDRCNVTQSTLSAGIKELEIALDQQLVIRGRKKISFTSFGTEVVHDAKQILEQTDKITLRAHQIKAPLSGPVRLGVIPTIAPYLLPQAIPEIKNKYPALELQLYEDLTERIITKINQGTLDLVLIALPFDTPGIQQMPLFNEAFVLASSMANSPQSHDIDVNELNQKDLLLLDDGHCLREHSMKACGLEKSPKEQKTYSATSLPTLIQMVNSGYGITLLPEMAAQPRMLPDNIKATQFKDPKPSRTIGLAWRSGHPRRKEFEILGQTIKDAAKK